MASLWIENSISTVSVRTRLMTAPHINHQIYAASLLSNVIQRFGRSTILMEHPRDDQITTDLLKQYQFRVKRDVWHMRLDL